MQIQNRNKDLTEVFNSRWNANHNREQLAKVKQEQHDFNEKMFGNKTNNSNTINQPNINYRKQQLDRLNNNIDAVRKASNMTNRNNFK